MTHLARYDDDNINEKKAVEKLLCVVSKKYSWLAISIETLLDLVGLLIEEVTGRLQANCNRHEPFSSGEVTIGGQLHLTEEEWLTS